MKEQDILSFIRAAGQHHRTIADSSAKELARIPVLSALNGTQQERAHLAMVIQVNHARYQLIDILFGQGKVEDFSMFFQMAVDLQEVRHKTLKILNGIADHHGKLSIQHAQRFSEAKFQPWDEKKQQGHKSKEIFEEYRREAFQSYLVMRIRQFIFLEIMEALEDLRDLDFSEAIKLAHRDTSLTGKIKKMFEQFNAKAKRKA